MTQKESTQKTLDLLFLQDVFTSGKIDDTNAGQRFYQALQKYPYEAWLIGSTINNAFYRENCSLAVERSIALIEKKEMFLLLPGFSDYFEALEEISFVDQTDELGKWFFKKMGFELKNVQRTIKGSIKITTQDVMVESDYPIHGISLRAKHIRDIHVANNHRYLIYGGTPTEMAGKEAAALMREVEAFIDGIYKHAAYLFEAYCLVYEALKVDDPTIKFGQIEFCKKSADLSEINEVICEETGISFRSSYVLLDNLQRIIFLNPELFSVYYWRIAQMNSVH